MKKMMLYFALLTTFASKLSAGQIHVHLMNDSTICQGSTLDITAHGNGAFYTWNSTAPYVTVNDSTISMTSNAGTNTVIVFAHLADSTIAASDTVNLYEVPPPSIHVLANDTTVAYGTELHITLTGGSNAQDLYWFGHGDTLAQDHGANVPRTLTMYDVLTITQTTDYIFYVSGFAGWHSCPVSDTVTFRVEEPELCDAELWVPNSFTPNGDSRNETFFAKGYDITDFHMMIFDRWGNMVFESTDIAKEWDGSVKGRTVQEDVYVVVIDYKKCGKQELYRNYVTVIR